MTPIDASGAIQISASGSMGIGRSRGRGSFLGSVTFGRRSPGAG
jgi:hypothetical protein